MSQVLKGKIALITGASRGIGKALAIGFAEAGATVVCIARDQSALDDTVNAIVDAGGDALAFRCDVTRAEDLRRTFDQIKARFGRLDIVVANAGGNLSRQPLEDSDIDAWEATIRLNLLGVYYTAKFAIPLMKENGGHMIVVGSGLGHRVGDDVHSAYSASKAGAWMLTRALAKELAPHSICVNELIPGLVNTELASTSPRPDDSPLHAEWFKAPEDVLPLALFMASQPMTGPTGQSFSLMRRDSQ